VIVQVLNASLFLLYISAISCPYLKEIPPNVTVSGMNRYHYFGEVITYRCNPGYTPEQVFLAKCLRTGQWSPHPSNLTCIRREG